jgi:hypothetical protein
LHPGGARPAGHPKTRAKPCSGGKRAAVHSAPCGTQWWISPEKKTAGLIMAQREMGHPFVVEFKRLAYEAVKRKGWARADKNGFAFAA